MKNKKIIFGAINPHVFNVREKPFPAKKMMPEWWKNTLKYSNGNKLKLIPNANITVKQCAPMLDSLSSGYLITTWSDIIVEQENGIPIIKWISEEKAFSTWSNDQVGNYEIPDGFSSVVFKYLYGWTIQTPPGWSCLITHPFGYPNIPIRSLTGIVDTDILKTEINFPFLIKEGFEGIIKKGTPLAQVLPIKRQSWKSEYFLLKENEQWLNAEKLKTKLYGYYSSLRERKKYD
jgi:hypothetical protein